MKRLLIPFLALLIVITFCACSDKKDDSASGGKDTATEEIGNLNGGTGVLPLNPDETEEEETPATSTTQEETDKPGTSTTKKGTTTTTKKGTTTTTKKGATTTTTGKGTTTTTKKTTTTSGKVIESPIINF